MAARVMIKVSGLNPGTPDERVVAFFEDKYENINVGTCSSLEDGTVLVELLGATQTELDTLIAGNHKICKRPIKLEIVAPDDHGSECKGDCVFLFIEVGKEAKLDAEALELYFESPKAGGRKGSIKSCAFAPDGIAKIEFDSPEVVASIMSITKHSLLGVPLTLRCQPAQVQHTSSSPSRIWLTEIPSVLIGEIEYLELLLRRTIGEELDFSLTQVDNTTLLLTFGDEVHLAEKELIQIAEKIGKKQVKGTPLKPTLAMLSHIPSVVIAKSNKKTKLLVTASEDIDSEHLILLLENALKMENDKHFVVSIVGSKICVVTIEHNLSDEGVESLIKSSEAKLMKYKIQVKLLDCCQLLLSELPPIEMAHLELQIAKMIGKGKEFTLKALPNKKSTALLEFKRSMPDEDIDAVIAVIANTKVKGINIKVQKLELPYPETQLSTSSPCRILLSEIPSVDIDYLGLLIEKATVLDSSTDFVLEEQDESSSLMTLKRQLSDKERDSLLILLAKMEVKGALLKVNMLKEDSNVPASLFVSNVPPTCGLDFLGLHLEKQLQMELGKDFTLSACNDESAVVTFQQCLSSQELQEAIGRINKSVLKGRTLKAVVQIVKKESVISEDTSNLLLQNMPDDVDEEYLKVVLSTTMGVDDGEFSVKCLGSAAALLTFTKCLPSSALQDRAHKIERKPVKGKAIKAVCWKPEPCICIRNITQHYDEEFLKSYFEKKHFGGSKVASVELLGNGEAVVIFTDHRAMKNVIQTPLNTLGESVTVIQNNPLENSKHTQSVLQNMQVKLSPAIVKALHGDNSNLIRLLNSLHVTVSVDVDQAIVYIVPSKLTIAGWVTKCESIVNRYIENNFAERDLPISKDAALEIIKILQPRNKEITYSISDDDSILHLVGHPNLLIQIQDQVNEIVADFTVVDKQIKLDPEDYEFLLQIKQQEMTKTFCDVTINFIPPCSVSVNGAAKKVKIFEENILTLSVHMSVAMALDPLLADFACTKNGREQIRCHISSTHDISVAVFIKQSGTTSTVLILYGSPNTPKNVVKAVSDIQKELGLETIAITSKCYAKLCEQGTSKECNELYAQLQKDHSVVISTSKSSISVAGFKNNVNQALCKLNEFIQAKCKVRRSIQIEDCMWQLLQCHKKSEWDSLVTGAKNVEVASMSDTKSTTVTFQGSIDTVDEACEALLAMQSRTSRKDVYPPACVVGFQEYAKSNEWKTFLSGAEAMNKVCITILDSATVTDSDIAITKEAKIKVCKAISLPCSTEPDMQCDDSILHSNMWDPSNLKNVKVHKGSLLDVKADVYVNSSNSNLDLSGGIISKILIDAAGPSLQEECSQKAPIAPGQIAITGSGNINCKYLFHLALNNYDGPGGSAEKALKESMDKCLYECMQQKISSVAFPALGTGQLSFPPQVAAKLMLESVAAMKDSSGLTVHIVIFMDTIYKAFEEVKLFLEQNTSKTVSKWASVSIEQPPQRHISTSCSLKKATHVPSSIASSNNKFSVNGVTVEIVRGDLTHQSTDVIVNSTSSDMKSTSGVSGAVLKNGGPELVKACEAYIAQSKKLDVGEVAVTPASGSLKCKFVFHINVNPSQLLLAVTTCLNIADSQKHLSISFPALATGNHKSAVDKVASEMCNAVHRYALQNPQYMTLIYIVIFQSELFDPFLKAFHLCYSTNFPLSSDTACVDVPTRSKTIITSVPRDSSASSFVFKIIGNSDQGVQAAATLLDEHLCNSFSCEKIDNVVVNPSLDVTKSCSDNYITLHHDSMQNTITLIGRKLWVEQIRRKIDYDNTKHKQMISVKREAELLQKHVEWQHQISDMSYVPYSTEVNFLIETAYQSKLPKYDHIDSSDSFCVDFKAFTETKTNPNCPPVSVRREDLLSRYHEEIPKSWEKMPIDLQTKKEAMYHLFDVVDTSKEFIDVQQKFASSVRAKKIVSIKRVQNTVLYGQYVARKKAMESLNPPGTKNERLLFHGTKSDICQKINSQGFNRSYAGANATRFGKGVYFAVNASYSANATYSPPDTNGNKHMYLVRVLTGEYTNGDDTMIVAPAKDPVKNPNVLFDSVVDNITTPSMYIVFQDAQAYPEYLITFQV